MKKICILILFIMLFAFLCACGKFEITCTLDKYNNAEMKIVISIPTEGLSEEEIESVEYSISELTEHLEEEGYETAVIPGDEFFVVIQSFTSARSTSKAFDNLLGIMSADTSPFSYVEGGYSASYFSDIYNISAEIDLSKIVDYEYIKSLPRSHQKKIMDALHNFSGTVTFDFLGETISHTGELKDGKNMVTLSLDEKAKISSVMEVQNTENKESYNALIGEVNQLEKQKQRFLLLIIAAASVLFIILAMSVIFLIKRRNNKKTGHEETQAEQMDDRQIP